VEDVRGNMENRKMKLRIRIGTKWNAEFEKCDTEDENC